jgi:hypothetical protein
VRAIDTPRVTKASDEPKIGLVLDLPTKFTFRNQAPGTEQNSITSPVMISLTEAWPIEQIQGFGSG